MRISYLLHQFSPKHTSPIEQYCFDLAREMKSRGNEVSIFAYQYSKQGSKLQQGISDFECDGIWLREIYHNYAILKESDKYEYFNPVIRDYADLYFEEFKPDIVHILHLKNLSTSVIDAAKKRNIPTILTPTDFWMLCPNFTLLRPDYELCRGPLMTTPCQLCLGEDENTLGKKIMGKKHQPMSAMIKEKMSRSIMSSIGKKFVERLTSSIKVEKQWVGIDGQLKRKQFIQEKCKQVDKVLAPSKFIADMLIESDYDEDKITVLPLGFNTPMTATTAEKEPSDKLRIGYIGTLNKHKGVHLLIEAMKGVTNKNVELRIYGDFTRFHRYTQFLKGIAPNDKRIRFKGTFIPEKIDEIFKTIDLLAIPSLWYENIPMVAYSALAHGTPVLAPSFGALPEIIRDGRNGLLFERGDSDDLRDKISRVLNNKGMIQQLRESITPPKTIPEHADELMNIFEEFAYCDNA